MADKQEIKKFYYEFMTEKIDDSIITRLIIYEKDSFGLDSCMDVPFDDQPKNKDAIRKYIDNYVRDDGRGGKLPYSTKTPPYVAYEIKSSKQPTIISK